MRLAVALKCGSNRTPTNSVPHPDSSARYCGARGTAVAMASATAIAVSVRLGDSSH